MIIDTINENHQMMFVETVYYEKNTNHRVTLNMKRKVDLVDS